jgi:NTP pyrophosphatase (non-canonical NTP hydrolase)
MGYERSGKAIYYKNISGSGNVDNILIADCADEEKADFLLNRILTSSNNFIRDAIVTCSPEFHADRVSKHQFTGRLNGAIDALNKLDQVKKSLFYGRDNNLITEGQADVAALPSRIDSDAAVANDIIHAILGFATEAGELLELLKATINGDVFDWVNAQEELGDAAWYAALLANRGGFDFEDYEQRIIKKLRARYADKFSAAEANERNLTAERAILEDKETPLPQYELDAREQDIAEANALDMRDEGDMIAGPSEPTNINESLAANKPILTATPPASGKDAVEAIEPAVDLGHSTANVPDTSVDAPGTVGSNDSELAKFPGARKRKLPGEDLARQPVRPEDV